MAGGLLLPNAANLPPGRRELLSNRLAQGGVASNHRNLKFTNRAIDTNVFDEVGTDVGQFLTRNSAGAGSTDNAAVRSRLTGLCAVSESYFQVLEVIGHGDFTTHHSNRRINACHSIQFTG